MDRPVIYVNNPPRWMLRVAWISCGVAVVARLFPHTIRVIDTAGFAPAVISTMTGVHFYFACGLITTVAMIIVIVTMHRMLGPMGVVARVAQGSGLLSCCISMLRYVLYLAFGIFSTFDIFILIEVGGLTLWWIGFNYCALRTSAFHPAIAWTGIIAGIAFPIGLFFILFLDLGIVGQAIGVVSSCGFAMWLVGLGSLLLLRDMHAGMAPSEETVASVSEFD